MRPWRASVGVRRPSLLHRPTLGMSLPELALQVGSPYEHRVTRFLRDAQPGYCEGTSDATALEANRRCDHANKGNWPLMRSQAASWELAVATCQQRCSLCAHCNFMSISLQQRTCEWFKACTLSSLRTTAPSEAIARSFKSAHAGVYTRDASATRVYRGAVQDHNLVCRTHGGGFGVPSGPLRDGSFYARPEGDLYQFGVAEGYSLNALLQVHPARRAWAFDTFTGMPDEAFRDAGEDTFATHWRKGMFRPAGQKGLAASNASELPLLKSVASRVQLVVGPFKQSLTRGLAAQRGMGVAAYVDIDADLYSSGKQVRTRQRPRQQRLRTCAAIPHAMPTPVPSRRSPASYASYARV